MNSQSGKQRSVSNNNKKSIDKSSGMEKDPVSERFDGRGLKRSINLNGQRERESYSTPPVEKTPEKGKTQIKKKKTTVE